MTDEKIIGLFQKRDEQAIRECIGSYGSYCRTVVSGILRDPADVDEALQDTWLAVWDAIPPQNPQCLRLFLGRIARNAAISIWRRDNARRRGGGEVPLALEELSDCVSGGSSPDAVTDCRELSRTLSTFLKTEPALRRSVFVRRYFYLEELSSIACRYGKKEANVRMMLSRTRQRLRKYLEQEGYIL